MAFRRRLNTRAVLAAGVCASICTSALLGSPAAADPLPTWSAPVLVDSGSILRDVSCPSTSPCVAVDFSGNVLATPHPDGGASAWTRTVSLRASFTTSGRAGANSFVFTGRLAGKKLAAGSYVLIATPSASGMSGSPSSASFRIIS
jgi:hypothetical protein